jgi:hypothetical protein
MSLFQLDETLSLLMESATEEAPANNGEIPDELRQALLDYCEAFGTKVDNIANYIKAQEGDRYDFAVSRRTLEARVGRLGRRVFGTTSARAISSFSRARASARLASWV